MKRRYTDQWPEVEARWRRRRYGTQKMDRAVADLRDALASAVYPVLDWLARRLP